MTAGHAVTHFRDLLLMKPEFLKSFTTELESNSPIPFTVPWCSGTGAQPAPEEREAQMEERLPDDRRPAEEQA